MKRFALVFLAQTACLGIGLWMQHRFTVSSAREAVETGTWREMDSDAPRLKAALAAESIPGRGEQGSLVAVVHGAALGSGEVTIVDPNWRVVVSTHARSASDSSTLPAGTPLEWSPGGDPASATTDLVRGRIMLPDGPHLAGAFELDGDRGFGIVHVPMTVIAARTAALSEALPVISLLTFVWTGALLGLVVYLIVARVFDDMDQQRSESAADSLRQTQDLIRTRDSVIFGLAKLAESRDTDTGHHLERISVYSTKLAAALRRHPAFAHEITPGFVRLIGISSALHDIGKVGVEDRILCKPGTLTPSERAEMQRHAGIGGRCLQEIEQRLGGSNFLQMAREIAFAHHENWDGSGYPNGLAGNDIPLAARIVAVADVYDALASKRVYKDAMPHERCVQIIREEAGKKFDARIVDVWLGIEGHFRAFAQQLNGRAERRDRAEAARNKPQDVPSEERRAVGAAAEVV